MILFSPATKELIVNPLHTVLQLRKGMDEQFGRGQQRRP